MNLSLIQCYCVSRCFVVSPSYGVSQCYGISPCYGVSPCYGLNLCVGVNPYYGANPCYSVSLFIGHWTRQRTPPTHCKVTLEKKKNWKKGKVINRSLFYIFFTKPSDLLGWSQLGCNCNVRCSRRQVCQKLQEKNCFWRNIQEISQEISKIWLPWEKHLIWSAIGSSVTTTTNLDWRSKNMTFNLERLPLFIGCNMKI